VVETQRIHPTSIFIDADNEVLLELWPISNAEHLNIVTNGKNIDTSSIQKGTSEQNNNFYYVTVNDIIEKCVHWREKSNKVIFFVIQTLKNALNMLQNLLLLC
jgi:hypothetical protein